MKTIHRKGNFKKDFKLLEKRGKDIRKLKEVTQLLGENVALPAKYKPHKLKGEYKDFWECHIEGDWLLIYTYDEDNLWLHRTGRHQDLFKRY